MCGAGARQLHSDLLSSASFELTTLTFRESAPNPEALVVPQRVFKAVCPHLAARADALGLARRPALLREECLRVGLRTQSAFLPLRSVTQQVGHDWSAVHQRASFLRTGCRAGATPHAEGACPTRLLYLGAVFLMSARWLSAANPSNIPREITRV